MSPILSRNHEMTGFATGTTTASALGVPAVGCLLLGVLGAVAADLPDIDSPKARIVKMLTLIPYPVPVLDKNGEHLRGKPAKPKPVRVSARATGKNKSKARAAAKRKLRAKVRWIKAWLFIKELLRGPQEPRGPLRYQWRGWPGHQLHRWSVWASETVYDRYATPADRRDTLGGMGMRFRSHRGLTHSLWAALAVGTLAWIVGVVLGWVVGETFSPIVSPIFGDWSLSVLVGVTVFVGMVTHVCGDGCTDAGVSFLAPLVLWKGRRYPVQGLLFEPMRFKTGQQVEKDLISWLCIAMAILAIPIAFGKFWPLLAAVGQLWAAL